MLQIEKLFFIILYSNEAFGGVTNASSTIRNARASSNECSIFIRSCLGVYLFCLDAEIEGRKLSNKLSLPVLPVLETKKIYRIFGLNPRPVFQGSN